MGVEPKIGVPPKDGENSGKPYEQMDDLGGFPIFLVQHPNSDLDLSHETPPSSSTRQDGQSQYDPPVLYMDAFVDHTFFTRGPRQLCVKIFLGLE